MFSEALRADLAMVGGGDEKVVPAERDNVEGVLSPLDGLEEGGKGVAVGPRAAVQRERVSFLASRLLGQQVVEGASDAVERASDHRGQGVAAACMVQCSVWYKLECSVWYNAVELLYLRGLRRGERVGLRLVSGRRGGGAVGATLNQPRRSDSSLQLQCGNVMQEFVGNRLGVRLQHQLKGHCTSHSELAMVGTSSVKHVVLTCCSQFG